MAELHNLNIGIGYALVWGGIGVARARKAGRVIPPSTIATQ